MGNKKNKEILAKISIIFGYVMESFFLPSFAFFMFPLIPVFFQTQDPKTTSYILYLLFGIGYVARPVGALVFGSIADKYGGKASLTLSLSLAVASTMLIALLPIREDYMKLSQLSLFVLRFLQGVGCGNNTASLSVYYHDNYRYKAGFITGITFSLGLAGFVLAKILSVSGGLGHWGWRTPFLVSGVLGFLATLLRYIYIPSQLSNRVRTSKIHFLNFLRVHKRSFFFATLTSGMFVMPLYICVFRLNKFAEIFKLEHYNFTNVVTILFIKMSLFLFVGYNLEKINFSKYNPWVLLLQAFIPCLFLIKSVLYNAINVYLVQTLFLSVNVFFILYYFKRVPCLFPEEIRYRAVGLSFATGYATLGGFCMIFFEYLDNLSNVYNFSALFIAGVALLLFFMDRKQKID